MIRRLYAILVALALFAATFGVGAAEASELEVSEPENPKDVAESSSGSYIVVMEDDAVVAELGAENINTPEAEALEEELEDSHDDALVDAGASASDKVQDFTVALNGFAARLSHDEAIAVAAQSKVRLVIPDELRQLTTDSSREFLDVTEGAHDAGVTGKGVVVGVIDSGIWPEHPSFADTGLPAPPVTLDPADGPTCDFGNTAHHAADAPFTCNNKLIGARQMLGTYRLLIGAEADEFDSARDDNGHGTHTASTAAGNAEVEASIFGEEIDEVTGIAPDAHVIAYKALGNLGGFGSDLAAAIDQAVADGVDVINYSVGGGPGLDGADAIAFLFAADAGVLVATSAGNSGPNDATLGGPGDIPWITTVGASTQERFFEGRIKLGNGKEYTGASVTLEIDDRLPLVDAEFAGGDLCLPGTLDPAAVSGKIVLCRRGAIARVGKSLAVFEAGGAGMILYNNDDVGDLITDTHWVPSVHTDVTPGLAVKAYIAKSGSPTAKLETGETEDYPAPIMAKFSSRGPNPSSSDLIKPDITAPGVQILAGNSPFVDAGEVAGELFQSIAGTSMSSPHVAGVFALIKQVHPDWTPAMAKSAIMTTADQKVLDNDRVSQATPFAMGAGHLDPGKVRKKGSAFEPGLVYDAGLFEYAAFSCGADAGIFSPASCDFLAGLGIPADGSDLNVPSIGIGELAGSQTVVRTVTSVANRSQTFRAKVEAPAGYDVTVSPSSIRLAPGESATFEVTITNDGTGVANEWAFGSLTWRGGDYEARSPIAVRGTPFSAPLSVSGAGTDGSGSIDVAFGYTGPYSANAHGMIPATVTSDSVRQDPDQNFDPADGFSNAHTFDLTDALFFRMSLPPNPAAPDVDLDVFVFDPSGAQVATSTAGGTNELIDIALPAPGVWTVYVHGWQTVAASADYNMSTWTVPTATGGSLSIDTAPASAVVGATGSIGFSWAGLTAGEDHLGVISHNDAGGPLGFTLVEVAG